MLLKQICLFDSTEASLMIDSNCRPVFTSTMEVVSSLFIHTGIENLLDIDKEVGLGL